MRDPNEVQQELAAAQVDLEAKVGQLKELVDDKLATPKRVARTVERAIAFVRAHATEIAIGCAVLGIAMTAARHRRAQRHIG